MSSNRLLFFCCLLNRLLNSFFLEFFYYFLFYRNLLFRYFLCKFLPNKLVLLHSLLWLGNLPFGFVLCFFLGFHRNSSYRRELFKSFIKGEKQLIYKCFYSMGLSS